ncbi:rust resistance kinase Lr10-like [Coffea arabica]|uniref:Rust resistance kinase Lr10-like n=1 Tax=Coffea arabica TaxID=13443 RepID=A0A6P6X9K1_COFAR
MLKRRRGSVGKAMAMLLFGLIWLSFLADVGIVAAQDECLPTRCGNGTEIRFPFWLKGHQPDRCGYPGFELTCSPSNATEMELQYPITASTNNIVIPLRVTLGIYEIDYKSQVLTSDRITVPECLPRQVPQVNSSASPFGVVSVFSIDGFSLFNCSTSSNNGTRIHSRIGSPVPCLSSPAFQVLYLDSIYSISDFAQPSCVKMYNISYVPKAVFTGQEQYEHYSPYDYVRLNWSKPSCANCEAKGEYCSLKINGTNDETECVDIPIQPGDGSSNKKAIIAGVTVAVVVVFTVLLVLSVVFISEKRKKEEQKKFEKFLEDYKALRPIRFSYADIRKITCQFKEKLGQGGYGTVYKGKISDDTLVAVKVLSNFKGNGEEFINEVGTIGRIHHINVVRLVGFCADGYRRALVYEFLPNDSLHKFISSGKQLVRWEMLEQIAIGIAKGLDYLHQGCNQRILHFDIKPHNILLDQNFSPKVADFGLAKLCSKEQSIVFVTAARGTIGYISPEMFSRNYGNVSYKSDVYSFGMLLLDMIGGRKNFHAGADDSSQIYYPEWVYNQLEKGETFSIQIDEEKNSKIFKKLAIVGLWCIQWYPADRPSMKAVIQMLEGENLPIMPPNPFASSKVGKTDGSFSTWEGDSISEAIEGNC